MLQAALHCTGMQGKIIKGGTNMAESATEVTESAKGFIVCTGSQERERMSHTRTAWS